MFLKALGMRILQGQKYSTIVFTFCLLHGYMLHGIDEHFQIEFLEGEQVFACNICDEGFDIEDENKKHIAVNHEDILIEISKNVDEEEDGNCSEESIMNDSELYAGFDEDGNRIVEDDYDEK